VWTAIVVGSSAAYLAWHVSWFGYPLANTVYAKHAEPAAADLFRRLLSPTGPGWTYVRGWLVDRAGLAVVAPALAGAAAVARGPARVVAAFAAAGLLLPVYHPDWMVEHRFVAPAVPFLVVLAAAGLDAAAGVLERWGRGSRLPARSAAAVALAAAVVFVAANVRAGAALRSSGYAGAVTMREVGRSYETAFETPRRELGLRDPLVLLPDIGATTFDLRMRIVDLAGLADVHVAHTVRRQDLHVYLFDERRPELVHGHGVFGDRIAGMPLLARDYVLLTQGPGKADFDLVRRDAFVDPLPPGSATVPLGGGVALAEIDAPAAAVPGATLLVDVYLAATETSATGTPLELQVLSPDGAVVAAAPTPSGPSFHPPARWSAGDRVRQRVSFALPPAAGGALALRLVAAGGGAAPAQPLIVDAQAASAYAADRLAAARSLAAAGDVRGMERALELAEAAAPAAAAWPAERAACAAGAARAIARIADGCLSSGDWGCALDALRAADRLGAARTASPELRGLGARLRDRGLAEAEPVARYVLLRASWAANPQDPVAQRELVVARRAAIASQPAPGR
jgi:hypothetical protein